MEGASLQGSAGDEFAAQGPSKAATKGRKLPATPAPDPATGLIALRAATHAEVAAACERLRALAAGDGVGRVACDARALEAELAAVDALARLALVARRLGCPLKLRRASPQLRDLVAFCGLAPALGVQREGQAEEREQALGVQERVQSGDPPV